MVKVVSQFLKIQNRTVEYIGRLYSVVSEKLCK